MPSTSSGPQPSREEMFSPVTPFIAIARVWQEAAGTPLLNPRSHISIAGPDTSRDQLDRLLSYYDQDEVSANKPNIDRFVQSGGMHISNVRLAPSQEPRITEALTAILSKRIDAPVAFMIRDERNIDSSHVHIFIPGPIDANLIRNAASIDSIGLAGIVEGALRDATRKVSDPDFIRSGSADIFARAIQNLIRQSLMILPADTAASVCLPGYAEDLQQESPQLSQLLSTHGGLKIEVSGSRVSMSGAVGYINKMLITLPDGTPRAFGDFHSISGPAYDRTSAFDIYIIDPSLDAFRCPSESTHRIDSHVEVYGDGLPDMVWGALARVPRGF